MKEKEFKEKYAKLDRDLSLSVEERKRNQENLIHYFMKHSKYKNEEDVRKLLENSPASANRWLERGSAIVVLTRPNDQIKWFLTIRKDIQHETNLYYY